MARKNDQRDLEGKVAIVTGASRGIGRAVATRLAKDGFAVVVNYAGNRAEAEAAVGEIEEGGGRAVAVQADVSDAAAVTRLFDEAEKEFGGVDILVNAAGVMRTVPIAETDDATYDRTFSVNTKGTFNTLRQAAKRLRDGGRVVNVSTSVLGLALPGYGAYVASKAAVEALTRVFANELRGRGVSVNAVAPGPTATALFLEGKPQEVIDRMAKLPPLERLGQPEDTAAVVAFLVGPEGGWVNGQTVRVNGGMV
jgi:3-oxoacyl-[acyl-carrier protein] reductase